MATASAANNIGEYDLDLHCLLQSIWKISKQLRFQERFLHIAGKAIYYWVTILFDIFLKWVFRLAPNDSYSIQLIWY